MDGLLPANGRQGDGCGVGSPVSRIGLALGVTYESNRLHFNEAFITLQRRRTYSASLGRVNERCPVPAVDATRSLGN